MYAVIQYDRDKCGSWKCFTYLIQLMKILKNMARYQMTRRSTKRLLLVIHNKAQDTRGPQINHNVVYRCIMICATRIPAHSTGTCK